jgi:hypothetical protein
MSVLPYFHTLHTLYFLYLYCANTNSDLDPTSSENMDSEEDSDTPPPMHIRWFHAGHGLAHLDLLATPIPILPKATSASITSWTAFTREESDFCETGWHALSDEQRANALAGDPGLPVAEPVINADDEVRQSTNQMSSFLNVLFTYTQQEELILGVPIGKERLFEVDLRTLRVRHSLLTV